MKIFQIVDGKAHWLTPYKSLGELYVEVPQGKGKTEKQRRYPDSDWFAIAPDAVQEGWIYLGEGMFRSDEPERLQAEIEAIDRQLRDIYKESLFRDWLNLQIAKSGAAMPDNEAEMEAQSAACDSVFSGFDGGTGSDSVLVLVKTKNELERKLKGLEPEIVSL